MKIQAASLLSALALFAWSVPSDAQTPPQGQVQVQPQTPRIAQGVQNPVTYTEVSPGVWVHGRPQRPIFSGALPIYPEAHDFLPGPGGNR